MKTNFDGSCKVCGALWKKGDKRLCFEQLDKDDKFEFMKDVLVRTKEIGIFKHVKRMPDFEIKDSIESMGFKMEDYL